MRKKYVYIVCIMLFVITRAYIWMAKPMEFSQITAVYMPYAHLWDSGVKPYLEQWYEYPPATIPLFYLPHLIDKSTINFVWHINYGQVYRGMVLFIDIGIFFLIMVTLKKSKVKIAVLGVALIYYCLATAKAHDFIYDAMDLVFAGAVSLGITAPLLIRGNWGRLVGWISFFLGTALKLINAPLGLIYATLERKDWKHLGLNIVLAGLIIWFMPLMLYRSSLSVMLVYHAKRGLQVESVPAQIVGTINRFTGSENYQNLYQSVNITGPVSSQVNRITGIVFSLGLIIYLFWGTSKAARVGPEHINKARIALTLGYIFVFMLTAKVLSTPFLLWQIPLLALYPYESIKQQLKLLIPSLLMIIISMTKVPNLELGVLTLHLVIGLTRSVLIAWLAWQTIILTNKLGVRNMS